MLATPRRFSPHSFPHQAGTAPAPPADSAAERSLPPASSSTEPRCAGGAGRSLGTLSQDWREGQGPWEEESAGAGAVAGAGVTYLGAAVTA